MTFHISVREAPLLSKPLQLEVSIVTSDFSYLDSIVKASNNNPILLLDSAQNRYAIAPSERRNIAT